MFYVLLSVLVSLKDNIPHTLGKTIKSLGILYRLENILFCIAHFAIQLYVLKIRNKICKLVENCTGFD